MKEEVVHTDRGSSHRWELEWTNDILLTLFLLENFIALWYVVLPSMPKREIVGYNYPIVCCLWCYTNVMQVIYQHLPRLVGLHNNLQCLPSIPRLYLAQTVSTMLTQSLKENMAKYSSYRARKVSKEKLVSTDLSWLAKES